MGTYEALKAAIQNVIRANGNNEITGDLLQQVLLSIVNSVGANSLFAGIAVPTTNPGTPDQNVFYIGTETGTYVNFGGIVNNDSALFVLRNKNGSWQKIDTGLKVLQYSQGIYLIPGSNEVPNIANRVLDLTSNPLLFVNGKAYDLRALHPNNPSMYRAISLLDDSGSSAQRVIFNVATYELYPSYWAKNLTRDEVVIGAIRLSNEKEYYNFPFDVTINGKWPWEESEQRQIHCDSNLKIMAHRGVTMNGIPENTLDAYRLAGLMGFDYAETDISVTSDGVLVLMHDDTINRTMMNKNGTEISTSININSVTYQELIDNYVIKSDNIIYRRPIPTLRDFFEICRQYNIFPIPELKQNGMTQNDVLNAYNLGVDILGDGKFGFCSFSDELLDYVRTLSDKIPLLYISSPIINTINTITGESRENEKNIYYPAFNYSFSMEGVAQYRKKGLKIAVWNVDTMDFDQCVKLGFDIIAPDRISPNIGGLSGLCKNLHEAISEFVTDGVYVDQQLTLAAGQRVQYMGFISKLSCTYISILAKGNYSISIRNMDTSHNDMDYTRHSYQTMFNDVQGVLTITAITTTVIQNIDYFQVKF